MSIRTNPDNPSLISLTDLHRAAGAPSGKRTTLWLGNDGTKEFISALAESQLRTGESKGRISDLLIVKPGAGGGTYAHWQIALAYAKYLSPELHMAVNEVYMRYKAGDPGLAMEVIEKG